MIQRRFLTPGFLFVTSMLLIGHLPQAISKDQPTVKIAIPPVAASPSAGRFQITSLSGQLYLLDSATGRVWKHAPNGKTDDQFFESKIKEDTIAEWSAKLGPTYQCLPLSYWLHMMRDGDEEFRKKGVKAIGHFGSNARAALPELMDLFLKTAGTTSLFDNTDKVILSSIARIDPHHELLRSQLHHKEYKNRRDAAVVICVLGEIDPNSDPDRQVSRDLPRDSDDEVEEQPQYKWRLPGDKDAIPVLIEMLHDRNELTDDVLYIEVALGFLASFKKDSVAAVPALTKMLTDKEALIRMRVPMVLAEIGPEAKNAIPLMRAGLKDTNAEVIAGTVEALGILGDRQSLPVFKSLIKHNYPKVRLSVVRAFGFLKEDT